ncbi:MAG TPA: PTS sugar transporter subunit IIA [Candidatus Krumholzibacteria bacterium]|nr:PTS sugar transporter subunit IIA [Candidatus Krumholzibacteria bacterium]
MQGIAFGPTIRLLRQAKGISLREMARQLGVSPAFLSQIEAGRQHKIPRARIVQVAEMLGVSEGYLLGTARQVHPDLMTFLSQTPEAAEFMLTAMRSGMDAQDFNQLREVVGDKKRRASALKPVAATAKKKTGFIHTLDEYVDPALCLTALAVQNKERLFQRFVKAFTKKHKTVSAELLLERLETREHQAPTSVGGGVAIPHAFVPGIDKPAVGAFLLQRAIPYGPTEADRVKTVFFLVGREGNTEHHLPILARIARLCSTPEFLQVLAKARTARDVHRTIVTWDTRIGVV